MVKSFQPSLQLTSHFKLSHTYTAQPMMQANIGRHLCGCYIFNSETCKRSYLPQVNMDAHTTILSMASRTVLTQTFFNGSENALDEIRYFVYYAPKALDYPRTKSRHAGMLFRCTTASASSISTAKSENAQFMV